MHKLITIWALFNKYFNANRAENKFLLEEEKNNNSLRLESPFTSKMKTNVQEFLLTMQYNTIDIVIVVVIVVKKNLK